MTKELLAIFVVGAAAGVVGVLVYQRATVPKPTVNSMLAQTSFDLAAAIKTAADQGITAQQLYDNLLKEEATKKTTT